MKDIQEKVIDFVADYTATDVSEITPNTLINEELGVDGEDGRELLLQFSKKFSVDLVPINETYFGPEGFSFGMLFWPVVFIMQVFGLKHKFLQDVSPLPVSVLIESAKVKKWVIKGDERKVKGVRLNLP